MKRALPLSLAIALLMLASPGVEPPTARAHQSGAALFPLDTSSHDVQIGCGDRTAASPCHGYHEWSALDFLTDVGTPVLAPVSGTITVRFNGCDDSMTTPESCPNAGRQGNHLYIEGDDGHTWRLMHLKKNSLIGLGPVTRGDVVALSGNTEGNVPHLHVDLGNNTHGMPNMVGCQDGVSLTYPQDAQAGGTWSSLPYGAALHNDGSCDDNSDIGPDFDNDGDADLAVGSPGQNGGKGAVHVLYSNGNYVGGKRTDGTRKYQMYTRNSDGLNGPAVEGDCFGASLPDSPGTCATSDAPPGGEPEPVAPDTTLLTTPPGETAEQNATFEFSSDEAGATFECRLDAAAWASCVSPHTRDSLTVGEHTFEVRAVSSDSGLSDETPATHVWSVTDYEVPVAADTTEACQDAGQGSFSDTSGTTHESSIECVAHHEVTQGRTDGTFGAADGLSRAQLATFMVRTLRVAGQTIPEPGEVPDAYDDDDGTTHEHSLNVLASFGILPTDTASIGPNAAVDRAEMARTTMRSLAHAGVTTPDDIPDYFDDDDGHPDEALINQLAWLGVSIGKGSRTYGISDALSRGQMASFLARTLAVVLDGG